MTPLLISLSQSQMSFDDFRFPLTGELVILEPKLLQVREAAEQLRDLPGDLVVPEIEQRK